MAQGIRANRHESGQILAGALITLTLMLFMGVVLVELASSANRTAVHLQEYTVSAARAEGAELYAERQLDAVIDAGTALTDGMTASGEVGGFVGGDATWEWEIEVTTEGAYQRQLKFVRGYGSFGGASDVMVEGELQSYSLLNYSWFSRTGTLSFGQAFRTDGDVYAGNDLDFNYYSNQYFGGRAEAGDAILDRGDDAGLNRVFRLEDMPRDHVGNVRLDTDSTWFQNTYTTAQNGGIVLPAGYDYEMDVTGVDFTQPGTMTLRRRTHRVDTFASNSGTWSSYSVAVPSGFNGTIFAGNVQSDGGVLSGDRSSVRVKGTLQRQSVTVVATDDGFVYGNTYGGTTNGDFVRDGRYPQNDSPGTGDPVNLAVVAKDKVRMAIDAPRILETEIAVAAVDGQIGVESTTANPAVVAGATGWDLDMNGTIETNNADGWNELTLQPRHGGQTITEAIWHLMTLGPFISNTSPTMGRWATYPSSYASNPHNRTYAYDRDVVRYPPPVFPAALSKYQTGAWVERKKGYGNLTGLEFLVPPV